MRPIGADLPGACGLEIAVPYHMAERGDAGYVAHIAERLLRDGAMAVFKHIYAASGPVVVETHLEEVDDPMRMMLVYRLHYRLTAVKTHNMIMPALEFVNYAGRREWKCPACAMVNPIEHRYCGEGFEHPAGCGRPRDFTNA